MNVDLIVSIAIIALSALVLHLKSHVKFIALGLFVGLVLAETAAVPLFEYVAPRFAWLNQTYTINIFQLLLLLIPTIILGINHTVDKKGFGPVKTVLYVVLTTLFLLSASLSFLPNTAIQAINNHSLIAFQLVHFRNLLVVAVALLLVADSFHHKQKALLKKKSKK